MADQDEDVAAIASALQRRHGCHTAILYGSRAAGEAKETSDFDVAGFADIPSTRRIAGRWRTSYVDAFVFPESRLENPDSELLHLRGGVVLFEKGGAGKRLLEKLGALYVNGPSPLGEEELGVRRQWHWKMLERAGLGDAEGNFRRAWLLTALLEDYFAFRSHWYPGPKKALAHLMASDPQAYEAFDAALNPGAPLAAIRNAVVAAVGEYRGSLDDELEPR